jgi:hypothetical protein
MDFKDRIGWPLRVYSVEKLNIAEFLAFPQKRDLVESTT